MNFVFEKKLAAKIHKFRINLTFSTVHIYYSIHEFTLIRSFIV